jgi:hypothetical protein
VRALRSRVAFLLAYADAQDSYGQFIVSLGLSPVPEEYQTLSVEELAAHVEQSFSRWARNEFPQVDVPPMATGTEEKDAVSALEGDKVSIVSGMRESTVTEPAPVS